MVSKTRLIETKRALPRPMNGSPGTNRFIHGFKNGANGATRFIHGFKMTRPRLISPDAVHFGAIIRRLRMARGWTRAKLSQRANITPQYLAIIERGGNVPSLTTVLELVEVLGADVADVMHQLILARNSPNQRR